MTQPSVTGAQAPADAARSGFQWLGIFAPIIGLAVAVVFLADTSWYFVFESIHVLAAIIWLGGGTAITLLAWRAVRANDNAQLLMLGRQAEWLGTRIFTPSVTATSGRS